MTSHCTRSTRFLLAFALIACPADDEGETTGADAGSEAGSTSGGGSSGSSETPTSSGTGSDTTTTGGSDSSGAEGSSSADSSTGEVSCGDPTPLGSFTPSDGGADGFAVAGDTVYLAAQDGGLAIVDVSDPAAPTELGILDFGPGRLAYRVAVGGDSVVFVGLRGNGWAVVDVSDPASPIEVFDEPLVAGQDVAWADDVLYVADVNGVQTWDVTDPAAPVPLSIENVLPGSTQAVDVAGSYAFATGLTVGLSVIDIADPAAPMEIVTTDHDGRGALAISGSHAFLLANDGVYVLDIADPTQPVEVGLYPGDQLEGVAADDRLWVLGRDTTGTMNPTIAVLDIVDPSSPMLVASYDQHDDPLWVEVAGGRVFYSEGDGEALHVLDGCP
jgi:hypothetical protein